MKEAQNYLLLLKFIKLFAKNAYLIAHINFPKNYIDALVRSYFLYVFYLKIYNFKCNEVYYEN